jgi:hypothetical protein
LWALTQGTTAAMTLAGVCLGFRMFTGFLLEHRMTGTSCLATGVIALMKDIVQMVVWAAAFTGRKVVWRGEHLRLEAGGKLAKLANN